MGHLLTAPPWIWGLGAGFEGSPSRGDRSWCGAPLPLSQAQPPVVCVDGTEGPVVWPKGCGRG